VTHLTIEEILLKTKNNEFTILQAQELLSSCCCNDIGFAKLDLQRKERTGFAEVVFCMGKTNEQVSKIFQTLYEREGEVLGTRATVSQYEYVSRNIPDVQYDPLSEILKISSSSKEGIGKVAVCTAGTADIKVAEEAAQTAEFFGANVDRFYDIGVCGLHRMLSQIGKIREANCIIAIAGMEGALPSVIGGLVEVPVIAVPTSVGYGANFQGMSSLLTMINSCANGISVVNIDNGYGGAYIASQINRLAVNGKES
jgi:NCAIR mutase (PurE)-related protein